MPKGSAMKKRRQTGFTMVELTVVILIISILTMVSVTVYTGYAERARFAVARSTIQELALNATRYEVDLGEFPLSSSGTAYAPAAPNPFPSPFGTTYGCGYLMLCLRQSYSADSQNPASPLWRGPYIEVMQNQLGDLEGFPVTAITPVPQVNLLDPWGRPYYYVRHDDYATFNATHQVDSPFTGAGEVYYNPSTIQIFSIGPDGETPAPPMAGLGADDINNFNMP